MKFLYKTLLISVLFSLLAVGSAVAYLESGAPAPDFKAKDLNGKELRLSDYKGQVIVLKLGTTWCPDCAGMTEDFIANGQFLKDNNIVLVDVFIQETAKTVSGYLKGKDFPMTFVPMLDNGQAHQAYQVYLIPRVVIIDKDFTIAHDGLRITPEALKKKITSLSCPAEGVAAAQEK